MRWKTVGYSPLAQLTPIYIFIFITQAGSICSDAHLLQEAPETRELGVRTNQGMTLFDTLLCAGAVVLVVSNHEQVVQQLRAPAEGIQRNDVVLGFGAGAELHGAHDIDRGKPPT